MTEKQTENVTTVRFSNKDKALLENLVTRLRKSTHVATLSKADVLRMGLDCLATREGIASEEK